MSTSVNNTTRDHTRHHRHRIFSITTGGEMFKNQLNRLITNDERRIVPKQLLLKYHKLVHAKNPEIIRNANRSELRSICHYYNSFAAQQRIILQSMDELIKSGQVNYEKDLYDLRHERDLKMKLFQ